MLTSQLTGRAQKAFAAMGKDQAGNYNALKTAILKRYNINKEAYRQRLRGVVRRSDESYRELATRVRELMQKWLAEYKTIDEVVEAVATEQLLEVLSEDAEAISEMNSGLYRSGTVDGKPVKDILLNTGCTRTLIHQKLIPREKKTSGEVIIRCAHGDEVSYPLAQVEIVVGGQVLAVEVGVSRTLPVSVLLGTDVPQLVDLLSAEKVGVKVGESMPGEAEEC